MVDNASTDDTKQVIMGFTEKDKRFKYLYQSVKGPSAARNMGVMKAEGEFIQFLDADDLLTKNKLQSAIALFDSDAEIAIVYSDMRYFADGKPGELYYSYSMNAAADQAWMAYVSGKRKEVLPVLLKGNMMVISSPLIKKSNLLETGLFNETLAYNEDWDLWLRFSLGDKLFRYDVNAEAMTLIRVHQSSHSRNRYQMYYCGLYVSCRVFEQLKPSEINPAFRKSMLYHEIELFKFLVDFTREDMLFELNKITGITGRYKALTGFLKPMPVFIAKFVLLILRSLKQIRYRFL